MQARLASQSIDTIDFGLPRDLSIADILVLEKSTGIVFTSRMTDKLSGNGAASYSKVQRAVAASKDIDKALRGMKLTDEEMSFYFKTSIFAASLTRKNLKKLTGKHR